MEEMIEACKTKLTDPTYLNAYDLCLLYCEVQDYTQDFDDMKSFLTKLIPKRLENHMICQVLKEIWIENSNLKKMKSSSSEQESINPYKHMNVDSDLQEILIQKI